MKIFLNIKPGPVRNVFRQILDADFVDDAKKADAILDDFHAKMSLETILEDIQRQLAARRDA